jgi:hypothetical protein
MLDGLQSRVKEYPRKILAAINAQYAASKIEQANNLYLQHRKEKHQNRTLDQDAFVIVNVLESANHLASEDRKKFGGLSDGTLDRFEEVARKIGAFFERRQDVSRQMSDVPYRRWNESEAYKDFNTLRATNGDFSSVNEKIVYHLWEADGELRKFGFEGVEAVEEELGRLFPKNTQAEKSYFERYQLDYHFTEILLSIAERLGCDHKRAPAVLNLTAGILRYDALERQNTKAIHMINKLTPAAVKADKPQALQALAVAEQRSRYVGGYGVHCGRQTIKHNLDRLQGFLEKAKRHAPSLRAIRRAAFG